MFSGIVTKDLYQMCGHCKNLRLQGEKTQTSGSNRMELGNCALFY